jgi:hypothetical protein
VEIYSRIIALTHAGALYEVALTSRLFSHISARRMYNLVDLSVLSTLLLRSDHRKHPQVAVITWNTERLEVSNPKGDSRTVRLGRTNQPIVLSPEQAAEYNVDEAFQERLAEAHLPAQTALLFRLCPNIRSVLGFIAYSQWFVDTQLPALSPTSDSPTTVLSAGLLNAEDIRLAPAPNYMSYDRPWMFNGAMVLRIMLLPRLSKLNLIGAIDFDPWTEAIVASVPTHFGTSCITDLTLCGNVHASILRGLIHVPKALVSFRYDHSPTRPINLTALADALVESPSRDTLQRVCVTNSNDETTPIESLTAPLGDLGGVSNLPSLRYLDVQAQFLIQFIEDERDVDTLLSRLPNVDTLGLRFLTSICKERTLGMLALCRIFEASKERLLRTLAVEPGSWDAKDMLELFGAAADCGIAFEFRNTRGTFG